MCGRGCDGIEFETGVWLGAHDGIFLGRNWVCARDGPWRFPGNFLSWIRSGRCSGVPGWKFPDGPRIVDLDGPVVGKWNGKKLVA